jgi:hypothetical protein
LPGACLHVGNQAFGEIRAAPGGRNDDGERGEGIGSLPGPDGFDAISKDGVPSFVGQGGLVIGIGPAEGNAVRCRQNLFVSVTVSVLRAWSVRP